jgi:hypothetical protein
LFSGWYVQGMKARKPPATAPPPTLDRTEDSPTSCEVSTASSR